MTTTVLADLAAYVDHLADEFRDASTRCASLPDLAAWDVERARYQVRMNTLRDVCGDLAALVVVAQPDWDALIDGACQAVR